MKNTKKIIVLAGLPASGKSTLAKELHNKYSPSKGYRSEIKSCILDFDLMLDYLKDSKAKADPKFKSILSKLMGYEKITQYTILDGLFTTQAHYEMIISNMAKYDADFEFHFFKEDREACLWNDQGRENDYIGWKKRGETSKLSIKNLHLEEPNIEELSKITTNAVVLFKHSVVRKEGFSLWIDTVVKKNFNVDGTILKSSTWSLGGTYGNCWDNHLSTSSGDTPPVSFTYLDDLLMEICPNITFLQGKKIYNDCVRTDTESEGDYYGGSTESAWYECNLQRLYNLLNEWGLICDPMES